MMDALPVDGRDFGLPPGKRGSGAVAREAARTLTATPGTSCGWSRLWKARAKGLGVSHVGRAVAREWSLVRLAGRRVASSLATARSKRSPEAAAGRWEGWAQVVCVQGAFGDLLPRADIVVGLGRYRQRAGGRAWETGGRRFPGKGPSLPPSLPGTKSASWATQSLSWPEIPAGGRRGSRRILTDPELYARMADGRQGADG